MITREQIVEKIRQIPDNRLPEVFEAIENFVEEKPKEGLLRRLQKIQIDAPPDFAENFDLYANGEKSLEDYLNGKGK